MAKDRRLRTLVECEGFANAKYALCADAEKLDEALEPLFGYLAAHPEVGSHTGIENIYILLTIDWVPKGIPAFSLYYRFDEKYVELLGIRVSDS